MGPCDFGNRLDWPPAPDSFREAVAVGKPCSYLHLNDISDWCSLVPLDSVPTILNRGMAFESSWMI